MAARSQSTEHGAVQGSIKTFRHVRARVRRISGSEWRAAWVEHLSPNVARLSLQTFEILPFREQVEVACHGDGSLASFRGVVLGQAGQEFAVAIAGAIRFEPTSETVRLRVEATFGTLSDTFNAAAFTVLDVSKESFGGLSDRPFTIGHRLQVSLQTPVGHFLAEVGVINCQPDHSGTGHFRIGLRILMASRLDAALWTRMLRERADA